MGVKGDWVKLGGIIHCPVFRVCQKGHHNGMDPPSINHPTFPIRSRNEKARWGRPWMKKRMNSAAHLGKPALGSVLFEGLSHLERGYRIL